MKKNIIAKKNNPIAELVDLNALDQINNIDKAKGLLSVIGKWQDFNKILEHIMHAYKSRRKDSLYPATLLSQ